MNKLKLSPDQFKIFELGNKITTPEAEYCQFPYWLKKNGVEGEYECLTKDQIPGLNSNHKRGGLESNKYIIQKTDGTEIDPQAFYFVLRLDKDPHAREAALTYAKSVAKENIKLSLDLLDVLMSYNPLQRENSEFWSNLYPYTILDPDGWDREEFTASWFVEAITWEEFKERSLKSTIISK